MPESTAAGSVKVRIAVAWAVVGVPLLVGTFDTLRKAWALFTG